jgi:penicillin-binding protein 1C
MPKSKRFNPLNLRETKRQLPKSSGQVGKLLPKSDRTREDARRIFKRLPWPTRGTFRFTWKKFGIIVGSTVAIFVIGIGIIFALVVRELPNPKELSSKSQEQSTKLLDRNGNQLYNFFDEKNRTLLKSEDISPNIKEATIALEDASFYSHPGFSVRGLTRAVVCRVYPNCGRTAGGGSTITQQYVKNALLSSEQTAIRKLKDLILAIEVEQVYTKDEILTGYLNEIPYGGSIYGVEAASQAYFGKSAKDLTLSEAATLASIPQRPTYYSPYGSHLDALFRRKDYVLDRMAIVGYITQEEADAAKKEAPNSENPTFAKRNSIAAPHFVFYVRQKLLDFMQEQEKVDPQVAESRLDTAGYIVTTSLDLDTQRLAENVMQEMGPGMVKKYNASNAALTAVDPKTGEIIAMVGSIDYEESKSGNTNFANALLQPGSSFKPFVFATAFDKDHKFSPASITYDLQTDFGNYVPQNYDGKFRGPITNRSALAQSLNIPAVKNLGLVGISDAISTAERLGISSLTRKPGDYGLSLVLGAGEVRPVEMAGAYGTFSNNGLKHTLRPVIKIEKEGQMVKDFSKDEPIQAIEPEVAYQITSILSDNNARAPIFGTRSNLVLSDRPVAAKSGTTNNNRDGWVVGYTPQISTAVWVGNNEANKTMTKGADGSVVAGPIWKRFMQEYLKGKPVEQFARPEGLREVTVDKLSGKLPTDQSPADQRVTDLFAEWQIPKDFDDVHKKIRIDRVTGKLATELTPAENIEERFFFKVRSEQPDNPNWEIPVQEWARANGGGVSPPTESDDLHTEENRPTVKFTSPASGSTVSGNITLSADAGGLHEITKVEFFINNISVGSKTSAPWSISYSAADLPSGSQILEVVATNKLNLRRSDQITVVKGGDLSAPGRATNVNIAKIPNRGARISWTNPSDADLANVAIYQSFSAGILGNKVRTVPATPGSNGTTDFTSLPLGAVFFTLRPIDALGNENTDTTQYSIVITGP